MRTGCYKTSTRAVRLPVNPPNGNRKIQPGHDVEVYKWLHLVENYAAKIKAFRAIETRYDKTDCSCATCWNLAATLIA